MKYIVLDTNVLVQNFWMDDGSFLMLLKNYKIVADHIVIPAIVRDETINQFEKKYKEQYAKIKSPIKKIENQLRIQTDIEGAIGFPEQLNGYREFFDSNVEKFNIEVVDYPNVAHAAVAEKAMKRQKPFKDSGEGYCDALIWESIALLLSRPDCDSVFFVTNNSKDFLDDENLHPELASDLQRRGLGPEKVSCYSLLKDFTDKHILHHLEFSQSLKDKINNSDFGEFDFESWIEKRLFELMDPRDVVRALVGLTSKSCDLYISEIYEIKNIRAHDVRLISGATRYVEFSLDAGVSCEICADWHQYQRDDELKRLFDSDGEYPAPYACTGSSGLVTLKLALVVEGEEVEASNLELISIEGKA